MSQQDNPTESVARVPQHKLACRIFGVAVRELS